MLRLYTCILLLISVYSHGQDKITSRIVLLGNTNEALQENPFFLKAVKHSLVFDSSTIILFLGNYSGHKSDTALLRSQADIVANTPSSAFFVPGYEDWARGKEHGYETILKHHQFIENLGNSRIRLYPGKGCPGPKEIDLPNGAELFIMDSQWWLHEHNKPDIESDCEYRTNEEILTEVEDIPKDKYDKLVLFVTHHPVKSTGVHSGTFGLKQHVFPFTDTRGLQSFYLPLPIIGSLYPILRNAVVSKQDMNNAHYLRFSEEGIGTLPGVKKAFQDHPNTIFIAGQEHNMQLLKEGRHYFIQSGAGGKPSRTSKTNGTIFASETPGFSVLEITENKKVFVSFYEVNGETVKPIHISQLLDYSGIPPLADDTTTLPLIATDSIAAISNKELARPTGLQRILNGENYRREWGQKVNMKVFDINTAKAGLKITGMGGGHESKTLQLKAKDGTEWVLRSMNKDLAAVIPEGFHETAASDFIHDMLSAIHPYGALVVPGLQKPLGIVHATPEVVFIPNDSALGIFRPVFANTVGQLEERRPALNENKTVNTYDALNKMIDRGDHLTDQKTYLKTRLVDFLIADFDRHHGQLSWGTVDSGGRVIYYPIPKDRDQALYHNKGLIMKIGRRRGYSFMANFPPQIKRITQVGKIGAYVDRNFTNALTEQDWKEVIAEFSSKLPEDVIEAAARRLPPEIYKIRGEEITSKLIGRRNSIIDKGMNYYKFLSRNVVVLGGNNDDLFRISGEGQNLSLQVFSSNSSGDSVLTYSRTFDPRTTKEISLFGFNGNDRFDVDNTTNTPIKLRIVGGKGDDIYNITGRIRNHLYDLSTEENIILSKRRTSRLFSPKPAISAYHFREPMHNSFKFPLIKFGFNPDDKLFLGVGISYTTHGFRKYPFASRQVLSTMLAPSSKAFQLSYQGIFNHIYHRNDLLINGELYNPSLTNFFGFGNETLNDPSKPERYYWARYDYASLDILPRKRFLNDSIMSIAVGPSVFYYWNAIERNRSRILENPAIIGLDSSSIYASKIYGGGKVVLTINNLDDELIPMRGVNWVTELTAFSGLNDNSSHFSKIVSTLDLYATLSPPAKLMVALHVGGGKILSKDYEYFQALTLGGNNYLRGFRRNRFAGSSMAYGSIEARVKLFDFNAYLIKSDFGLVGFNDVGRVWIANETSRKWHHGYGGGIYLSPFNSLMLSALMGFSKEDMLFNVSIGTKLNYVF